MEMSGPRPLWTFNSLVHGRQTCNLKSIGFKLKLRIDILRISREIFLKRIPRDPTDAKWTSDLVMAWRRQVLGHYLSQCWPRSRCYMASLCHNHWCILPVHDSSPRLCIWRHGRNGPHFSDDILYFIFKWRFSCWLKFTEYYSSRCNWHWVSIDPGNDVAPTIRQAITRTNGHGDPVICVISNFNLLILKYFHNNRMLFKSQRCFPGGCINTQ